ncbi:MAG: HipA N-terminal domain-containing protein [Candidatus Pacebacteria bacterium]|nr:HipA N-terminal domain-containing protein [Candidatus Paceibacterota bacterium]
MNYKNMIAIGAYIESRKKRTFVGMLTNDGGEFIFEYDNKYIHEKSAVSLGPEFALTRRFFHNKNLFASLKDRIPSKQNPAYGEYCRYFGINEDEDNEMILLVTIGRKGPSSFVLEPIFNDMLNKNILIDFRKSLNLTIREFATVFDFSASSLSKIEKGHSSGRDVLKRLNLYQKFPEIALYELEQNRVKIHSITYQRLKKIFAGA